MNVKSRRLRGAVLEALREERRDPPIVFIADVVGLNL